MNIVLTLSAWLLVLLGAAGTIFPALPGLPLMFAGAWLLAHINDYQIIGSFSIIVILLITLFGMAMDFVAGLLGAKYTGASKTALWGAFIGGIVGIFFGLAGLILGPLLGAVIGEFIDKEDLLLAGKVGIGTFIGFIIGTIAKVSVALTIVLIIVVQYISHWIA
ncbi:MAG: DUF456 family protein [Neisseriaceae bacterium]|nr:DUF456 family protein [Neisseriaceae bacterium]